MFYIFNSILMAIEIYVTIVRYIYTLKYSWPYI